MDLGPKKAPVVFGCIDAAGAEIGNADVATEEIVEVEIDVCGGVDGDIHVFIADGISADDCARDGCAAHAAVEVNSGSAGRCRVSKVDGITRDAVADDDVVVEIIGRQMEVGSNVGVKGNAGETIVQQLIIENGISRDEAYSSAVGEDAYTCASTGETNAIVNGLIPCDQIVNDAVMWSGRSDGRLVRGEDDTAGRRVVVNLVVDDEIVVRLTSVVADEDAAGVARNWRRSCSV